MGSIMYLEGRRLPWRAQVKRKGMPKLIKHFLTKDEAELWEGEQERSIRLTGLPLTISILKDHTVREIVERYRDEITPTKGGKVSELSRLNRFLNEKPGKDLCDKSLAYLSQKDGWEYIRERQAQKGKTGEPITARTISRERNLFQDVFELAKTKWGYTTLVNPFRGLKIKEAKYRRTRRLEEGEEALLMRACKGCHGLNQFYVPLAMDLAIETGMREQELFNLIWGDIDLNRRQIKIRKSKTDHLQQSPGRTIPLTWSAMLHFGRCMSKAEHYGASIRKADRVFPMTQGAFMQTWNGVVHRAGIKDLQFRDLRHEAGSRFNEADLSNADIGFILGHAARDTTEIYINQRLKVVRDKLDVYTHGRTFEEYWKDELAEGTSVLDILLRPYSLIDELAEGLTELDTLGFITSAEALEVFRGNKRDIDKRIADIERRENRKLRHREIIQIVDQVKAERAVEEPNVIPFPVAK